MGDHSCGGPGEAATPPPDSSGSFDKLPYKQTATNGPGFLKPGRAMPPRVDTSAASMWSKCSSHVLYIVLIPRQIDHSFPKKS